MEETLGLVSSFGFIDFLSLSAYYSPSSHRASVYVGSLASGTFPSLYFSSAHLRSQLLIRCLRETSSGPASQVNLLAFPGSVVLDRTFFIVLSQLLCLPILSVCWLHEENGRATSSKCLAHRRCSAICSVCEFV